jgi:branched-chain amino acid transport system ATP-binding protein
MSLLEVRDLVAGYGSTIVLHGVTLALNEGERIGLFGPNGHGKTTLLRTISGLLAPRRGEVRLNGVDIAGYVPREIVKSGLIHVPQGSALFPEMTVLENLELGSYSARARSGEREQLDRVFALFPRLAERQRQLCKSLSGGERQMVAIGIGLMSKPKLLMLDEPTLGLAPKLKDELCEAIAKISRAGVPLVLVEQDVEFLLALTDRLYLIDHGEVAVSFAAGEQLDHDKIMEMYFGRT